MRRKNVLLYKIFISILAFLLVFQIQGASIGVGILEEFSLKMSNNTTEMIELNDYTYRFFPIHIHGDDELQRLNFWRTGVIKGKGTFDDPYIISGWKIDCIQWFWEFLNPHVTHNNAAIWLENIHCHVVIEDNLLYNLHQEKDDNWFEGIYIEECSNITIRNNNIKDSSYGITMAYSPSSTVCSNEVSSSYIGIVSHSLSSENPIEIYDNSAFYCGDGIRCVNGNAEVFDNEIKYNGEGIVLMSDSSHIASNNVFNNQEVGIKCVDSPALVEYNNVNDNGGWGIGIKGGPTPMISRNTISNNQNSGIYLADGDVDIENNSILFNEGYGIYIADGRGDIVHNLIHGNPIGIRPIDDSKIFYNEISSNTKYGIRFGGSNPIIHYNNIEDNKYGLYRQGGKPWVSAEFNWWGAADGPGGDGPGSGDPVTYQAIYTPWLTSPCLTAGPID
mgnify:CR=1 FL=1